jgi:hypothetical protein
VGVNGADVAVGGGPPESGRPALVKTGAPVQVALLNSVNVTVPVGAGAGAGAPVTVAVSETGLPIVTVGVAMVEMATGAWVMVDVSLGAPQALVTAA